VALKKPGFSSCNDDLDKQVLSVQYDGDAINKNKERSTTKTNNYSNLIGSPVVNMLDLSSIVKQQHAFSSKDSLSAQEEETHGGFPGAADTVKLLKGAPQPINRARGNSGCVVP
jgi:hypothetical protein